MSVIRTHLASVVTRGLSSIAALVIVIAPIGRAAAQGPTLVVTGVVSTSNTTTFHNGLKRGFITFSITNVTNQTQSGYWAWSDCGAFQYDGWWDANDNYHDVSEYDTPCPNGTDAWPITLGPGQTTTVTVEIALGGPDSGFTGTSHVTLSVGPQLFGGGSVGIANVTWNGSSLTATFISPPYVPPTYTPALTPKTSAVVVPPLSFAAQGYSVVNSGNGSATFTLSVVCSGALTNCNVNANNGVLAPTATLTVASGETRGVSVQFWSGAIGTAGTAQLTVTAPARPTGLVETDAASLSVSVADFVPPYVRIQSMGIADPDGGDPIPLRMWTRSVNATVDVGDADGIVGVPTATLNGVAVAASSVVATTTNGSNTSKHAIFPLTLGGGYNNTFNVTVSDGFHTSVLAARYSYDEAPDHNAVITPAHPTSLLPINTTATDSFYVRNPGWQAVSYAIGLTCSSDFGACTATTTSPATITVGPGATAVVPVSFPIGGHAGYATHVGLNATYHGALATVSSSGTLTGSAGALFPPTVTLTPTAGTVVTTPTTTLVAVWCDPDDALAQHTVTWQGVTLGDTYVAETRAGCLTAGRSTWSNLSINLGTQTATATAVDAAGHTASASTTVTFRPPVSAFQPLVSPKWNFRYVSRGVAESESFTVYNSGSYAAAYTLTPTCAALPNCAASPATVTVNPGTYATVTVSFTSPTVSGETDAIRLVARYTATDGAAVADTGAKTVEYLESTYTPAVTPKTTRTVAALQPATQLFTIYNNGSATGSFALAARCTGSVTGCTLVGASTVTIAPSQSVGSTVSFVAGAAGTTGTASLIVTAPPRMSQLVEVDTGRVTITAADLSPPGLMISPANDPDPATGAPVPFRLTARNSTVTVDVYDIDGVVGAPTLTIAGATIAPTSVVATTAAYGTAKRALYTLPFQPGNNTVTVSVSDGVHTTTAQQSYAYDDAPEHAPQIVPLHAAPQVPVGRTVVDTFLVTNPGWHSAAYAVSAWCSFDVAHTPSCTASTSPASITVGPGATASVPVSYSTDPFVGHHLYVALGATYAGPLGTIPIVQSFMATVAPLLPPQIIIAPANGTSVSSSTINLVVNWCDPDDGIAQRTVTWQGVQLPDAWTSTTVAGCTSSGQSIWNNLAIDPWQQTAVVTAVDAAGHTTTNTATITRVAPLSLQQPLVTPKSGSRSVAPHVSASETFTVANAGSYAAAYALTPSCRGVANCVASPPTITLPAGASAPVLVSYTSSSVIGERDTVRLIARFTAPTGEAIADTGTKIVAVPVVEFAPSVTTSSATVVLPPGFASTAVFTLANSGTETATYALHTNSTGGFGFANYFTPPTSVTLDPGQSTFVTLQFAAPNVDGVAGSFTLTADYLTTSGATLTGSATASLRTQTPRAQVVVSPKANTYIADAGSTTTQLGFGVTNTGNVGVVGRATIVCPSGTTTSVLQCGANQFSAPIGIDLSLIPGQSTNFLIDLQLRAGTPGRVQLAFDGASDALAVHDTGAITVRRAGDFVAVAVTPKAEVLTARPHGTIVRRFTITNTGSLPAAFDYVATCAGGAVTCSQVPGSTGVLAPSQNYAVTVTDTTQEIGLMGTISLRATDGVVADTGTVSITTATVVDLGVDARNASAGTSVDRGGCLTIGAGDDAAYECGDLRLVHPLPATTTMNKSRAPTLVYNSRHHSGIALFAADVAVAAGNDATSLTAHVIIDGKPSIDTTFGWDPQWSDGTPRRIVIPVNVRALALTTGAYHYTLAVDAVSGHSTIGQQDTGTVAIVNRATSPFGPGWWVDGLEQLIYPAATNVVLWVGGDGTTRAYTQQHDSVWTVAPAVDRPDTLIYNPGGGSARRLLRGGGYVQFDGFGQHVATQNAQGHRTTFGYVPGNLFSLRSITLPVPASSSAVRQYTFVYGGPNNYLSEVDAPVGPSNGSRHTRINYLAAPNGDTVVANVVDPDATTVAFGYDTRARIVSRTNRRQHTTTFEYDSAGGLRSSTLDMVGPGASAIVRTFCAAETASLTACAPRPVVSATVATWFDGPRNDVGDTTWFQLDRFGAPRVIVDALHDTTRIERGDARWPMLATVMIRPNGQTTTAQYDTTRALLQVVTQIAPFGDSRNASTMYEWDARWSKPTAVTVDDGGVTIIHYDSVTGNRLWQQAGRGDTTRVTFGYNGDRQLDTILAPRHSAPQTYQYDSLGNLTRVTTPRGVFSDVIHDYLGRDSVTYTPVSASDPLVNRTTDIFTYDAADRVLESLTIGAAGSYAVEGVSGAVAADTLVVDNQYDEEGNLKQTLRRGSRHTQSLSMTWTYDAAHRKLTETNHAGRERAWQYDLAGNVIADSSRRDDPLASSRLVVRMAYDTLNRLSTRITPGVSYAQESCIASCPGFPGWLAVNSGNIRFPYFSKTRADSSNEPNVVIAADTARFFYDRAGLLQAATNRDAKIYREYFPNGALKLDSLRIAVYDRIETPDADPYARHEYGLRYTYDRAGHRLTRTDVVPTFGVNQQLYSYDSEVGLLTSTSEFGTTASMKYDAAGRLYRLATGSSIVETREYDDDDQLYVRANNVYVDTLAYDARGKVIDAAITSVRQGQSEHRRLTYSGLGALVASSRARGSGIWTDEYEVDGFANVITHESNRMDSQQHRRYTSDVTDGQALVGTLLLAPELTPDGPPPPLPLRHLDESFYEYDRAGNQIKSAVAGRKWTTTTGNGSYDATLEGSSWARSYYDAENRLRVFQETGYSAAPNGTYPLRTTVSEYRYDALGRRVLLRTQRDTACVDTECATDFAKLSVIDRFVWDGDQMLYEFRTRAGYAAHGDALEAPPGGDAYTGSVNYMHAGGIDQPLAVWRDANVGYVPFLSWRGGFEAVLKLDGSDPGIYMPAADREAYLGADVRQTPQEENYWLGSLVTSTMDLSGLMYMRNRYYDPKAGRFTQEDPIGLAGGANLYGFAGGDPVNSSDPLGLSPSECPPACAGPGAGLAGAAAGAAGGAAALLGATSNPDVVAAGINAALDAVRDKIQLKFVTYTRTAADGRVYSGRTRGFGDPQSIVNARVPSHPDRLDDFGPAVVDAWATGFSGYEAIRGREQQLIDLHGGARSDAGSSANLIRGVSRSNWFGLNYWMASNSMFGPLAPYTGNPK